MRMMLLPEFVAAGKLLRRSERLTERWRSTNYGDDLPSAQRRALAKNRAAVDQELRELAAIVLARQLGLRKYMVLHVRREGGYEDRFQLLVSSIREAHAYSGHGWMWSLEGRRLRKNGTIGDRGGGMSIAAGTVTRRMLDGRWVELQPFYTELG